jgi:superfamily II DNA/RNA helicase
VDNVGLVVHFDAPTDAKAYLHRSGRTARAGESGTVVTITTPRQLDEVARLQSRAGVQSRHHDIRTTPRPMTSETLAESGSEAPAVRGGSGPRNGRPAGRSQGGYRGKRPTYGDRRPRRDDRAPGRRDDRPARTWEDRPARASRDERPDSGMSASGAHVREPPARTARRPAGPPTRSAVPARVAGAADAYPGQVEGRPTGHGGTAFAVMAPVGVATASTGSTTRR